MIKNSNTNYYLRLYWLKGKYIQISIRIFAIFILSSILLIGTVSSSLNTFAQTNENNSNPEVKIETQSTDALTEENDEKINLETSSDTITNETSDGDDNLNILNDENKTSETLVSNPDGDCLFDPSLPKCAPDENGNCPEGFNMNEDGQCFPKHSSCPDGYHSADDDETGRCISNSEGCPSGMIFRHNMKTCGYKEDVCRIYPNLEDCKVNDDDNNG